MSSSRIIKTLGDPSGGRTSSMDGNAVSGSFASYVVRPTWGRSCIGSTKRLINSGIPLSFADPAPHHVTCLESLGLHRINRHQLDVEIPQQLERAVQARLIWHPADQV